MWFDSVTFLVFFPLVTALYFAFPHRYRAALLLVASVIFYMAFIPSYIFILLVTIVVDYIAGRLIETSPAKRLFLILSIVVNVGFLAFFKYFNFINDNLSLITRLLHQPNPISNLNILLPIGLSFHTFQAMSYTIEIYMGRQKAERHFGIFALYVLFYPQLVAGLIDRRQNLLHQFYEKHLFHYARVVLGLKLMAWGFFKKIVIANGMAQLVNPIYNKPHGQSGLAFLFATICFAFQIYCRLRRLHRHRPGLCARHGLFADGEFQKPLSEFLGFSSSGHAGISRSPPGSRITFTFRSAVTGPPFGDGRRTC